MMLYDILVLSSKEYNLLSSNIKTLERDGILQL